MNGKPLRILAALALLAYAAQARALDENDYFKPLGRPPEAKQKRIKGGEGVPPLPLPATPLRRSERKREPAPPTLIGKVVWGAEADFVEEDGTKQRIADWNLAPADCQQLLKKAGHHLKLRYREETVNLNTFSGDPAEMPVLFFSGGRTLRLPEEQIALLRKYVLGGGMLWMDSVAGSPFFYQGCVDILKQAFPEEPLRPIPMDHPLYHMIADVEQVNLPQAVGSNLPQLEGLYVGCRVGVVVSKFGLGCGWDDFTPEDRIKQALFYDVRDANLLGLNLVSYAVGYHALGLSHARPELFGLAEGKTQTDEFVFAQVRHHGVWNTDPGGPGNLLRTLATETQLKVVFRRQAVKLGEDSLEGTQFLYMSGCHDLTLSEGEVRALQAFLHRGGTLLIDNAQGLQTFDQAVRRELKKVVPGAGLQPIDAGHEIFSTRYRIQKASYTPAVQRLQPKLDTPALEGLQLDGDLRILYSPYDLGGGWQGDEHPQAKGYSRLDALRLGVNLVVYAMTH
ncbi:MAG: DUF4159 domain-containing protein [Planctomycetota bacterium]|nr:DUF4159 domain-containing protein [Planctomycetota bacterium]